MGGRISVQRKSKSYPYVCDKRLMKQAVYAFINSKKQPLVFPQRGQASTNITEKMINLRRFTVDLSSGNGSDYKDGRQSV
jgi:hypothetical protein